MIKWGVRIAQCIFSSCQAEEGAYADEHKQPTTTKQGGKRPSKADAMLYSAIPYSSGGGSANRGMRMRTAVPTPGSLCTCTP